MTGRTPATVNEQVLVCPQASQAVIVTELVVFAMKNVPEGGEEAALTLLHGLVAMTGQNACTFVVQVFTLRLVQPMMVGGVATTVMVLAQVLVLLQQSADCH